MKKILLGTTAIVGASFVATAAMAAPEVRIGGFFDFQVGWTSQDVDRFGASPGGFSAVDNTRGYGFLDDSEVILRVSDKLDNGLAWALKIEMETSEDQVADGDETVLTLSGRWGQFFMGNEDGPVDTMKTGANRAVRNAGTGGVSGDFRRWVGWDVANGSIWSNGADPLDTSDATKIAYITPRFAGFQAGVSFSADDDDTSHDRSGDDDGTFENWWEMGVSYDQKFGDFRVNASGVMSLANAEDDDVEDVRSWYVGALVGFGGFTVGAGYGSDGDSMQAEGVGNDSTYGWSVGVGYNMGAWDFGLSYYQSQSGANAGNAPGGGDDKIQVVSLGTTYDLGNGLSTYAEVNWFKLESANDGTLDNDGYNLITGIAVEF